MEMKIEEKNEVEKNEKGATMVEYAMMIALVAAVCIVAITNIGTTGNRAFATVGAQMNTAVN